MNLTQLACRISIVGVVAAVVTLAIIPLQDTQWAASRRLPESEHEEPRQKAESQPQSEVRDAGDAKEGRRMPPVWMRAIMVSAKMFMIMGIPALITLWIYRAIGRRQRRLRTTTTIGS